MEDPISWVISFVLLVAILLVLLYQILYLDQLTIINPYDLVSRVNVVVVPEFIAGGVLCLLHLIMGHWIMFLLCLPLCYYGTRLYTQKQHSLDVNVILNQLPWEKKTRSYKTGYIVILIILNVVWQILKGQDYFEHIG